VGSRAEAITWDELRSKLSVVTVGVGDQNRIERRYCTRGIVMVMLYSVINPTVDVDFKKMMFQRG